MAELFIRTIFHNLQKIIFTITGFTNENLYINNLKRIEYIITNDYRNFVGEDFSAESEGSCSVASENVRSDEEVERTDDFEFPGRNEEEGGNRSGEDSEAESDERSN